MKEEVVRIFSVHQLNKEEIDEIKKILRLKGNEVVENMIDKDLLGGLRIVFGNRVFDLSLKGRLNTFRNILYETR